MSKTLGDILSEEKLDSLADRILEEVDYDIFKEDLEERNILNGIFNILYDVNIEEGK